MHCVVHSCAICKKVEVVPYSVACSPDLLKFRVSEDLPFTHTGLDIAGPLFIHDEQLTESNELQKVYICLFTCASTRGIHLESTNSLDFTSFLLALCRFSAWRGMPATLISDNDKSFKAASKKVGKISRSFSLPYKQQDYMEGTL